MCSTSVASIGAPVVKCQADQGWLDKACELLRGFGFVVIEEVLPESLRVAASLDEYYRPPEERFYRAGQG